MDFLFLGGGPRGRGGRAAAREEAREALAHLRPSGLLGGAADLRICFRRRIIKYDEQNFSSSYRDEQIWIIYLLSSKRACSHLYQARTGYSEYHFQYYD